MSCFFVLTMAWMGWHGGYGVADLAGAEEWVCVIGGVGGVVFAGLPAGLLLADAWNRMVEGLR